MSVLSPLSITAAEYNIWVDPEAAQIVFNSGLAITMVGWDNSYKYAMLKDKEMNDLICKIDDKLINKVESYKDNKYKSPCQISSHIIKWVKHIFSILQLIV